ncbi:MAG: aldehyde ferredoxin oxidoreductase family protein [Pseudomonadota bacterium]
MKGFYNQILSIDLTERRYEIKNLPDAILETYLGGKGLASHLLLQYNPAGVDPIHPSNNLIFATGPATGSTVLGSCRYGLYTKSPQTGFYAESYSGGRVPEAMDAAGFDAILIRGRSNRLTVLGITPDGVTFHDADDLKGKDTYTTEDEVKNRFGTSHKNWKKGAVVIGPAGENGVRFAVVENDYWRSAGRTGIGAVMGSKNLKAILFMGDRKRALHDQETIKSLSKQISIESKDNPSAQAYKNKGTPMMVEVLNRVKAFPTRYWSEGTYENWEKISAEALHERCDVSPHACLKCVLACGRLSTVKEGRHAGLKIEGPEYETIYAFGGLCCIDSIEEIVYLNDICDRLGMDTISAGNLCAFAIEAARRKKIGYNIDYGEVDAIAELLHKIAFRKDEGDILSKGITYASKEWGLEELAVHVKGLEPAGYDPRVLKGVGLGYATSDRGACHLRATFYKPELSGMIDPSITKGKAELFVDFEDRLNLFDSMVLCRFYRDLYPWDLIGELIQGLTGLPSDTASLRKMSSAIADEVRRFNIREGLTRGDDRLPLRLHKESLKSGHSITEEELETMVDDYYRLRGWDEEGKPR